MVDLRKMSVKLTISNCGRGCRHVHSLLEMKSIYSCVTPKPVRYGARWFIRTRHLNLLLPPRVRSVYPAGSSEQAIPALFYYSRVTVSHDNVRVTRDPETEAAEWNSSIVHFIIYTFFYCDLSECSGHTPAVDVEVVIKSNHRGLHCYFDIFTP